MKLFEAPDDSYVIHETKEDDGEIRVVFYNVFQGHMRLYPINVVVKRVAIMQGEINFHENERYDYLPRYYRIPDEKDHVFSEADGRIEVRLAEEADDRWQFLNMLASDRRKSIPDQTKLSLQPFKSFLDGKTPIV